MKTINRIAIILLMIIWPILIAFIGFIEYLAAFVSKRFWREMRGAYITMWRELRDGEFR